MRPDGSQAEPWRNWRVEHDNLCSLFLGPFFSSVMPLAISALYLGSSPLIKTRKEWLSFVYGLMENQGQGARPGTSTQEQRWPMAARDGVYVSINTVFSRGTEALKPGEGPLAFPRFSSSELMSH